MRDASDGSAPTGAGASLVSNSMPAKAIDCGQRIVGKTADSYTGNLDAMYTDYNDGRYYFEKLKLVNFKCRVRGGLQSFRLDRRTSPPSGYVYINDHGEETACTRMSIVERKGHQFDCSGPPSGPLSPLMSRFHAACAEHDLCYKTPGTSRIGEMSVADVVVPERVVVRAALREGCSREQSCDTLSVGLLGERGSRLRIKPQ